MLDDLLLEELRRAEAAVTAYFMDSTIAANAAVSEVRVARMFPEDADAVWCKFGGPHGIRKTDAVLVHAIERGRLWLFITPTEPRVSRGHTNPHTVEESSSMKKRDAFEGFGGCDRRLM